MKTDSVTRFGEISPSGQHFYSLGNCLIVNLLFGKILNPIWTFKCYWAHFHCDKWVNIEKII